MSGPVTICFKGCVTSLHLHPLQPGDPLQIVESFELVAGKGISGNGRYFDRTSRTTGQPSRRQVSLIEREQISEHAAALRLESIPSGSVRANIETSGIDLISLLGQRVAIGEAILHFYEPRRPCSKMDAICLGLRELMEHNRQGMMAEVIHSGRVKVGDSVIPLLHSPQIAAESC